MPLINLTLTLSPPARRAWYNLRSHRQFDEIADLFFDTLRHERYRSFAVEPVYYTDRNGVRRAKKTSQSLANEKAYSTNLTIRLRTLQKMKRLQSRGLALSWQAEEILYFGFLRGLIATPESSIK